MVSGGGRAIADKCCALSKLGPFCLLFYFNNVFVPKPNTHKCRILMYKGYIGFKLFSSFANNYFALHLSLTLSYNTKQMTIRHMLGDTIGGIFKGTVSQDFCSGFFLNQFILVPLDISQGCFDFFTFSQSYWTFKTTPWCYGNRGVAQKFFGQDNFSNKNQMFLYS